MKPFQCAAMEMKKSCRTAYSVTRLSTKEKSGRRLHRCSRPVRSLAKSPYACGGIRLNLSPHGVQCFKQSSAHRMPLIVACTQQYYPLTVLHSCSHPDAVANLCRTICQKCALIFASEFLSSPESSLTLQISQANWERFGECNALRVQASS
jgi:hypothetical protein